jgi:hypothetical protein
MFYRNRSFMDFLFHVPFFCTAAAAVAEILSVCYVNIEFREPQSSLWTNFSFRPNIISRVPKRTNIWPQISVFSKDYF